MFISQTPGAWQSDNFTDELAATGLQAPNRVERIHDFNPGLGGPIQKDRLWFFGSFRRWGVDQTITDSFYNLDPTHKNLRAGPAARPTVDDNSSRAASSRLTCQMARKHKFSAYLDRIVKFRGHECPALSAEEACGIRSPKRYFTAQAKYTATLSSRLLVEAGLSENDETYSTNEAQPSVQADDVARFDRTTTEAWSAPTGPVLLPRARSLHLHGAVSYVTGSHAFKTGVQLGKGGNPARQDDHGRHRPVSGIPDRQRRSLSGVGVVYNTPQWCGGERSNTTSASSCRTPGRYKRLTLNPGIRVELFNTYVARSRSSPAGRFVPARQFDPIDNLPNWNDWAPRLGARLRRLRRRQDGAQGARRQVHARVLDRRIRQRLQPAGDPAPIGGPGRDPNGDDIAQDSEIGPVVYAVQYHRRR